MKRRLSKREWNIFVICVIIIMACLGYKFLEPIILEYRYLREEIEGKEAKFLRLNEIILDKEDVEKAYQRYEKILAPAQQEERGKHKLLKEIDALSSEAGLHITNIKPLSTKEEGLFREYAVRVEAEGNVAELAKFLYISGESSQVLNVERLEISSRTQQTLLDIQLLVSGISFMSEDVKE